MRALLALVLAVLLPLQMGWAVAGDACAEHAVHGVMADAGATGGLDGHDHPGDDGSNERSADLDCHDACHHYTAMVTHGARGTPPAQPARAQAPAHGPAPGLTAPRPERPQWRPLA